MFDSDRLRTDINLLSWYLRHPTVKSEKKVEVDEKVESVDTGKYFNSLYECIKNFSFYFII